MISGLDRYYQIARCFRDEDSRKDRQPEFTQLDLEMACVTEEDILSTIERVVSLAVNKVGFEAETPFRRMTYRNAMSLYGSDKPETRFEMLIQDATEVISKTENNFLKSLIEKDGVVRALVVNGAANKFSRKELEKIRHISHERNFLKEKCNVLWAKVLSDKVQNAKFLSCEFLQELGAKENDLVFLIGEENPVLANTIAGDIRLELGEKLGLLKGKEKQLNFLFITEFPLFESDPETGNLIPTAHPFTGIHPEDIEDLENARGRHCDLVLNGVELGSGSIRIHQPEIQQKIFDILGLSKEEQEERFGFLLEAFEYGAPPHGGFALGIDRLLQILTNSSSIREVIAFPKLNNGTCPLTSAPSPVSEKQLKELNIKNG